MIKVLEELFLKIFQVVVVVAMSLLLIATVALAGFAISNFNTQEKKPSPIKDPPSVSITADDFLKVITQEDKPTRPNPQPATATSQSTPISKVLPYQEQSNKYHNCLTQFLAKIGQVPTATPADVRAEIERLASEDDFGIPWADAVVDFSCALISNPKTVDLIKQGKITNPLGAAFNFHIKRWAQMVTDKKLFLKNEEERIEKEKMKEEARVAASRALALTLAGAAGGTFLAFMFLALYLIIAKVEMSLRVIANAEKEGFTQLAKM